MTDARTLWREGHPGEALAAGWAELEHAGDPSLKALIVTILHQTPELLAAAHESDFIALLKDPDVDPGALCTAGWLLALRDASLWTAPALERSPLALTLLREDLVTVADAELALTRVRRDLLFSQRRQDFPRLTAALIAQGGLNGGAWLFEDDERAALAAHEDFVPAYLPRRVPTATSAYDDPVTRAVAQQYEGWPYPAWKRATRRQPERLAEHIAALDPGSPPPPSPAEVLIAGCGTGRQVAQVALRWPRERFTAIDISAASLDYARERCAALGLTDIRFRQLDLHDAAALGQRFDAILCTGVLHHLPDPERGWAVLADRLSPGGVMRVMVYSRIARLRVAAIRRALGDLPAKPIDDDLLRAVRRRALSLPVPIRPKGRDFFSLAGVHDLFLHRHEDPFDLPRIRRDLDALGLELIRFELPTQRAQLRYRTLRPGDSHQRDFDGWSAIERENPTLFFGMYDFWCRKRA